MRNGQTLKHYAPGARGSSNNPLTREEESAKALDLVAPVLGKRRALAFIDAVWNIEKMKDMHEMRNICRA